MALSPRCQRYILLTEHLVHGVSRATGPKVAFWSRRGCGAPSAPWRTYRRRADRGMVSASALSIGRSNGKWREPVDCSRIQRPG
jgi:hypothetical protein